MTGPVSPSSRAEDSFPEITSLFHLFFIYWDVCSKRETEYTAGQVGFITENIFGMLRNFRNQEDGDMNELRTVCSELDRNNEMLNPDFFLDKNFPYIFHLRNWYIIS